MMEVLKKGARGASVKELQKLLNLLQDGIFGPITEEAVKAFQKSHGLIEDGIVGAKTWSALKPSVRAINKIIVHCTATPEGKDFTVAQIKQAHLARGFGDIGYHYVVYRDGSIHAGRAEHLVGAHCAGYNTHSVGVSYVGGCAKDGKTPKDTRTPEQRTALKEIVQRLRDKYPSATVHGHYEFANKACPSFKICDL